MWVHFQAGDMERLLNDVSKTYYLRKMDDDSVFDLDSCEKFEKHYEGRVESLSRHRKSIMHQIEGIIFHLQVCLVYMFKINFESKDLANAVVKNHNHRLVKEMFQTLLGTYMNVKRGINNVRSLKLNGLPAFKFEDQNCATPIPRIMNCTLPISCKPDADSDLEKETENSEVFKIYTKWLNQALEDECNGLFPNVRSLRFVINGKLPAPHYRNCYERFFDGAKFQTKVLVDSLASYYNEITDCLTFLREYKDKYVACDNMIRPNEGKVSETQKNRDVAGFEDCFVVVPEKLYKAQAMIHVEMFSILSKLEDVDSNLCKL